MADSTFVRRCRQQAVELVECKLQVCFRMSLMQLSSWWNGGAKRLVVDRVRAHRSRRGGSRSSVFADMASSGTLASSLECLEARELLSAAFPEFLDPHDAPGNQFGSSVAVLTNGNVVITSPFDDAG